MKMSHGIAKCVYFFLEILKLRVCAGVCSVAKIVWLKL